MEPAIAPLRRKQLIMASLGMVLVAGAAVWWHSQALPPSQSPKANGILVQVQSTLYFTDSSAQALVPVAKSIAWSGANSSLSEVQGMVASLQQAPPTLQAAVPAGVKVVAARFQSPHWFLELQAPPGLGGTGEQLLLGAVVRSILAATHGAEGVHLKLLDAQGQAMKGVQWDLTAPLRAGDFATQAGGAPTAGLDVTLWWPLKEGKRLVPTKLKLTAGEGLPPKDAFVAWLAGPPDSTKSFLASGLPQGSEWRWEGLDAAGMAELRVTGERVPRTAELESSVRALVLTLTEWPMVKSVRVHHPDAPWPDRLGPLAWSLPITRTMAANGVEGTR